jgi:hypothetical protein
VEGNRDAVVVQIEIVLYLFENLGLVVEQADQLVPRRVTVDLEHHPVFGLVRHVPEDGVVREM